MSDVLVIVQARPGGQRLPGKIGMPIQGKSMLSHVCARAAKLGEVFIATPPEDMDEDDVLGRFVRVAALHPHVQTFVRITADCPLLDWQFSLSLLDYFQKVNTDRPGALDFIGTGWELDGLDTEVFSRWCLMAASMLDHTHREHVTKYMRQHMLTKIVTFPGQGPFRWSVDDQEGLDFVRRVYDACEHCASGQPHHSNAAGSIGGNDKRVPVWDVHAGPDGGLLECTAYEIRMERVGGDGYKTYTGGINEPHK